MFYKHSDYEGKRRNHQFLPITFAHTPSSATPCLAGFFALRCFSLITIWVTPESWAVKPITSLPHWFYTRILRVPKCFSPQAFSLTPKSAHNLGRSTVRARNIPGVCRAIGNVPRAFRLPLSRWWPFSYRIGLPETDNPTPCLSFCGPLLLLETFASKLLLRESRGVW